MRTAPSQSVAVTALLLVVGCGLPETGEAEVGTSQQELTISPGDTRCAAQKVGEVLTDYASGPYLFVGCSDHPVNVFDGQTITVSLRDPQTGAVSRQVLPDYSRQGTNGLEMVERSCAREQFFRCPCGIGEETVTGTIFKAKFCKSQSSTTFP